MILSCLTYKSVYFKEKKDQVPDENLFHQTNKQSVKGMVSACLTWKRAIRPYFLLMDVEWEWMHRHTNNIYGNDFHLPFNAFIYIKTGFLFKTMHHHTVQTSYNIFYMKQSIHLLSTHMNSPPCYLIAAPSVIIFRIKWKKKYMKTD